MTDDVKCGNSKKATHDEPIVSLMFLLHFAVFCDLFSEKRHSNMCRWLGGGGGGGGSKQVISENALKEMKCLSSL